MVQAPATAPPRAPLIVKVGDHFNQWTVVELAPPGRKAMLKVRCGGCERVYAVRRDNVVRGISTRCVSCGRAASAEKQRIEGCSGPGYLFWRTRHGRRCLRWSVSTRFFADVGKAPSPEHSLSTPDAAIHCGTCAECRRDGHTRNVVWALPALQREHRSLAQARLTVTIAGRRMTVHAAAKLIGLSRKGVWRRINVGWTLEDACTVPPGQPRPRRAQEAA